jgi:hypothetical protein
MAINAPCENRIASIAQALCLGVDVAQIRIDLLDIGYSEYGIFLAVKAAETHILMSEREFPILTD